MIYYKFLTKLSQYAQFIIRNVLECSIGLMQKWLDTKNWQTNKNPISIDLEIGGLDKDTIIKFASELMKGRYLLFGRLYDLGERPRWDTDFESGFVWGKGTFYKNYNQVDLNNKADVKYPRELSRFHHALLLGQAFYITQDISFYGKFRADVLDWLIENPYLLSINWGCTQDVAIRAVNWLWALAFFQEEIEKDIEFKAKINHSLYQHGHYIYMHPEKNSYNNHNHYISDLVGQIYLGLYFKYDKHAANWLNWGIEELFRELRYQILPSGPSYERSVNYHRFVAEMVLSAVIILDRNNYEIPKDIWYRIEKMLEFVMYYTKPDGFAPVIGDLDDARLLPFTQDNNLDHKYLLCIGAVLFLRGDFKYYSGKFYPDCAYLIGKDARSIYDKIDYDDRPLNSRAFPDAGFYIIRNEDDYLFINNSGKSKNSELGGGTHTHSDLLSFELAMGGKTFMVDPGSYVYSGNPDMRLHLRSTRMHNTITVDDENQNRLERNNLWDFPDNAKPSTLVWKAENKQITYEGEHKGYLSLKQPVLHKRKIQYDMETGEVKITDLLTGEGNHKINLSYHFDIGIKLKIEDDTVCTLCDDIHNIILNVTGDGLQSLKSKEDLVSKAYGLADNALTVVAEYSGKCPFQIVTEIKRINK